jgi:hypothetical protein
MPAAAAATVAPAAMISGSKDHQSAVEIKVTRHDFGRGDCGPFCPMKFGDTFLANAGFV